MKEPKEAKEWWIGGALQLHMNEFYTKHCAPKRMLAGKKQQYKKTASFS